jgi:two-component system sensor histidine kinase/response regulator
VCFLALVSFMTSELVSCPQCGGEVDPQTKTCVHCGVGLALAALLAERNITTISLEDRKIPLSPEVLVPRLGDYLIEKGVLKPEDLDEALKYQAMQEELGQPRLIGQTLLEMGLVEKSVLDLVITEQILQLQSALQKANSELEERVRERTNELENALNRLSELNQLKSNFIANISHELRTPLTHLKGYLDLLREGEFGQLSQRQMDVLEVMHGAELRLENLIEDLIQFSLVARGELDLKIVPLDIEKLLEEIIPAVKKKCQKSKINFISDVPNVLPNVDGDPQKINWVLSQFLDNAIKFTPESGDINLHVKVGKKRATFSVIDTGIGIDPNRFSEIFEPFHQLDNSATRKYGGTGLGLAMAKRIIEAHGSTIKVESTPGKGSNFNFTLPLSRAHDVTITDDIEIPSNLASLRESG